jgi:ABC-2 type transport system permease protein
VIDEKIPAIISSMLLRNSSIDAAPALAEPGLVLPALSLCQRELVRFLRQRHRVIGALATPIVFWLLIGGGMGHSFTGGSGTGNAKEGYMQYFFPGTVLMILLFTAIFSTISVIEDRREGFLQSVLVAPVSRMAVVLGKILGGTVLATGQGLVFLLLAPTVGIHLTLLSVAEAVGVMAIVSFALTALGLCIAWRMSSTQGFHAIMNLFLMPMWFLSGALFPAAGAMGVLAWIMRLNPLSYGLGALRTIINGQNESAVGFSLLISLLFAAVMFGIASMIAMGTVSADLQ